MNRRKFALSRILVGVLVSLAGLAQARAGEAPEATPSPPTPSGYALGFTRGVRFAAEWQHSLGSSIALKRQGSGLGVAVFFPLPDSGFDLGIRYAYIHEARNPIPPSTATAYTLLTFVFDYFVWPTKVGGLFVGGELGVTDPAAGDFFSVYSDYVWVAKFGYEYTIPNTRWSATFEARRTIVDDAPLKVTRQSQLYSNGIAFGARYRL